MHLLRPLLCLLLALISCVAEGQAIPPSDQLPDWIQDRWKALAESRKLEISTRINPFVWQGDFDGDGRQDLVILVKHIPTRKEGIAIFTRRLGSPRILGAGTSFGNGGDDFSWIDIWSIQERGSVLTVRSRKPVKLDTDGIYVAKESSASAVIYLKSGKATWQQQGD